MARILYIFPHPDDESFGPALAISQQKRGGDEVHLLTLTKGGATKQRIPLGLSIEEMGEVRFREMQAVARVLSLDGMTVLDLPDSGLKEMDPRELEAIVSQEIQRTQPDVIVTYAVGGVSGFEDHLVCHAVVKRVFVDLRDTRDGPACLAMFTLLPSEEPDGIFTLRTSREEEVDCAIACDDDDVATAHEALACYATYKQTIAKADPLRRVGRTVYFEFFQEKFDPRVSRLDAQLPAKNCDGGG